jgi:hypothetical protein
MCDSIQIVAYIDRDLSSEDYGGCNFPSEPLDAGVSTSADFRFHIGISPLTGARFKITPLGMQHPINKGQLLSYGRIAGYLVEVNPPACTIGHNRQLVNGVPMAMRSVILLLKTWLAANGCTKAGLERIKPKNAVLVGVTLTYLYAFETAALARAALFDFRNHSEAVMNKGRKGSKTKPPAFSIPKDAVPIESENTFTSYVRQREWQIAAYIKQANQPNGLCLPLDDDGLEVEMQALTERTLRVEVTVHAKWLRDEQLHAIEAWIGRDEPYARVFALLRLTLKLDVELRKKRLKKTTIPSMALTAVEKKFMLYHRKGGTVYDHKDRCNYQEIAWQKFYSAMRTKVIELHKIDLDIPYDVQIQFISPELSELLVYPGEHQPVPHFAGYQYSRITMPVVCRKLTGFTDTLVGRGFGASKFPSLSGRIGYQGIAPKPGWKGGFANAPQC